MYRFLFPLIFVFQFVFAVCSGQTVKYNLEQLLADHKLGVLSGDTCKALTDGQYKGVTCSGIVWINSISFSTGSIDVDIRGRDVYQQNFLGIAFHGNDTTNYD